MHCHTLSIKYESLRGKVLSSHVRQLLPTFLERAGHRENIASRALYVDGLADHNVVLLLDVHRDAASDALPHALDHLEGLLVARHVVDERAEHDDADAEGVRRRDFVVEHDHRRNDDHLNTNKSKLSGKIPILSHTLTIPYALAYA